MNPLLPDDPETPDSLDGPDFREASYDDPREPEISFARAPRPAVSPAVSPAILPAAALAAPPARVDPLNLAGRPFLNSRPVVRAALLLWLLGALLLLGNVSLFWSYRQRSAVQREKITRGEAEIAKQQAASSKLQSQLDSFELESQNQRIDFLNKQIEERIFSWNDLLDRVAERLPHDVRLNRLAPLTGQRAEKEFQRSHVARHASRASDQVSLLITGESRSDTELLSFVQSLFRPPFAEPDLTREERQEDGKTLSFEINVQYRPGAAAPAILGTSGAGGSGAAGRTGTSTAGTPAPRIEELPMPAAKPARPAAPPGGRP